MIDCLVFYIPVKVISLISRRHQLFLADEGRQIYTYAVHLVQWGIFYMPTPIPWHGTSIFKVSSEWPVTFLLLLNV